MGAIFYQEAFPSFVQLAFNHAIPFPEVRSDAACRIAIKISIHLARFAIALSAGEALWGRAESCPPTCECPPSPEPDHPQAALRVFVATQRAASRLRDRMRSNPPPPRIHTLPTHSRPIHDWFPLFLCPTPSLPTPYLRRTIAVPPLVHPRISPRNPNMKRRRYGDGTAMIRP